VKRPDLPGFFDGALATLARLPGAPNLPGVPDPLRRVPVPDDLDAVTTRGEEADPRDVDMTAQQVERIWDAAVSLYRSGVHPAVQLCVRREGAVVLDRAIGHAHGKGPDDAGEDAVLATPETPYVIFSASKAITAFAVHLLDQQGKIHIADPVVEYFPEFAKHGKEAITIAQLLAHRAGIPNVPGDALDPDVIGDLDAIAEVVADLEPLARPGKGLAYHAVSGGYVLGEVVRRVTGMDLREFMREHVLDPLGFRWMNYGVEEEDVPLLGRNYATGLPLIPPLSSHLAKVLSRPVDEVTALSNDPRCLRAVIPSANVVTTATELSRFFEVARRGGELDGVRVWEPRTIRRALTEQSYLEIDRSLGFPTRFSYGFMLGAQMLSLFGPDTERAFGHLGFTNILGWADPERALSCALITSGKPVLYPEIARFWGVGVRIGNEASKVAVDPLADPLDARSG
jgi:CubicO group peptidase (beta-lactamase class C family)